MELIEGKITASDLSQVVIVKLRVDDRDPKSYFSEADFEWRKKRSKRKIKKLDYDVKWLNKKVFKGSNAPTY